MLIASASSPDAGDVAHRAVREREGVVRTIGAEEEPGRLAGLVDVVVREARAHGRRPGRGAEVAEILAADPAITHVLAIHCETSSGILNPIEEIAEVTQAAGRKFLIDSMSAFGTPLRIL